MKNIFPTIFIFSLITLFNPSNQLSLDTILNINNLFNSMLFNPLDLLFTLTKNKLQETDVDFSCTLCQRITNAVTTTIREKYGYEGIEYYAELLCSVVLDRGVCNTYITKYGPVFIDSFILRAGNEENLCHKLGFCYDGEDTEDTYDYAIRLLKDKPKNKKRESVDYTAPTLKMIQLTDIHLDTKYIENGTVFCDEPVCCRTPASTYSRIKSGKFGHVGRCDASLALLDSFMDKAYELNPDFIIWTGDNSPHNSKNSTQEDNYEATVIVKEKLDAKFKNSIPIYPALGNHEKYPADLYIGDETELLEHYAQIFKDYFYEDQAFETFRKYGYYTEKYKNTNLRIVVLNCLVCDTWNFYIIGGRHEAAKQEFIWLEEVLRQAEKDGEYVYLIDHFPINSNFELTECAQRLRALFDRFDYIIRGFFSGHTHLDDISPVKTYFEPKPIININYIAPPLTTYPGRNPSFRQFILDSNTKNVIDYEQYRLNITEANEKKVADWHIAYKATEMFNVNDLTELDKIFKIDVDGEYIIQRYAEGKDESKIIHNKKEIRYAQCQLDTDTYHDYYVCAADTIFSKDYLWEFLNDISGEWAKNPSS
jgi:uncharacterized protein YkuJ